MADWQTSSSDSVYRTQWFDVRRDEVRNHNGKSLTYSYLKLAHPGACIIAVNGEGKILLQRNFRYPIGKTVWELPAGHSDGQDLLVAAKRELLEETGLASDDWTDLGSFYIASGIANAEQRYFLARNVCPADGERDEDEQITEQSFFTIAQIEAMLKAGDIQMHAVPIGVYLAKLHGI